MLPVWAQGISKQAPAVIQGLAVISAEPKEFTVVNIVGPVNLEKLSKLEGQFGVPDLGLDQPKPKKSK